MLTSLSPRNLSFVIFKRRKTFLGAVLLSLGLYAALVLTKPLQYESTASIMVKVVDQDMVMPDLMSRQEGRSALSSANLAKTIVNSEQVIITSPDVLANTLKQVGVEEAYPKAAKLAAKHHVPVNELAIELLLKDLAVQLNNDTNILMLSLFNTDAVVARRTLEALITATVEKQASIMRDPRLAFLEQKLASLKTQSDAARAELLAFKQKTSITSFDEERSLLLKQRDETQLKLSETQADLVSAAERGSTLEHTLNLTPKAIQLTDENDRLQHQLDEARARLSSAEARYEVARQRFTSDNPELRDQQAQLALARQAFTELTEQPMARVRTGANPLSQKLSGELTTARSEREANRAAAHAREQQLDEINKRLAFLDGNEAKLRELEHHLEINDREYRSYLERVQSARILSDMNQAGISNLSVVQRPTLPYKPARPRRLLMLALALFAGFACGLGASLVLELLDDRISLPEQIEEATGLPVLVTVNWKKPG
jgi:succinoglycan biosynthesis transport protein ExoP